MKMIRTLLILCILIAGAVSATAAAPITLSTDLPPEPTPGMLAGDLLTSDGRLRQDEHVQGRLDSSGRNMTLAPHEEPIVSPQSQSGGWQNLGSGLQGLNGPVYAITVSGTDVYVGGAFTNAGGVSGANNLARWDGTQWHAVGGTNAINGPVYAIVISGSNVYVGGAFASAGGVNGADNIARWDGTQWHALGSGINYGIVYAIAISGSNVYVGGAFTSAGGVNGADNIARWDGTQWHTVGAPGAIWGWTVEVRAIAINGSDVYVGGWFRSAGGVSGANYIARWDGAQWHAVGAPESINGTVYALAVSGSDVYVGGYFANRIARWDGTQWHALGSGTSIFNWIQAIAVSGSNVYIGGNFYLFAEGGMKSYLARWDGTQWHALGGEGAINRPVYALAISGSNVYVGGDFVDAGGAPYADRLARWDGAQWQALGSGAPDGAIGNPVNAIAMSGSDVYVGGEFANAGVVSDTRRIARWDGSQWHALGSGIDNGTVNAIAISGSDVYVGGSFTNAGGVSGANRIAR